MVYLFTVQGEDHDYFMCGQGVLIFLYLPFKNYKVKQLTNKPNKVQHLNSVYTVVKVSSLR